ncbi:MULTISPECIES: putative immunity protein [unclassified Knoellia]|uniref:putative immunity protein n=1 Tax=Knoellia altitudinis TaxID=3404795 RepID=UPI0036178815
MILPEVRDPRLVTIRRGGTLTDADHHLLALWAATCAEHVLDLFETIQPGDDRPRRAIEHARAWVRSEVPMMVSRAAGGHAMGAARPLRGAARFAAYAAGQAACVAHVPEHDLGAAAYAIKAVGAAVASAEREEAMRRECQWQRDQLPARVRDLVLEDQERRNDICWSVFAGHDGQRSC